MSEGLPHSDENTHEGPPAAIEAGLSEAEHQALDMLAELPLGDVWTAARSDRAARDRLSAGLGEHGETAELLEAAVEVASRALVEAATRVATDLLDAAAGLVAAAKKDEEAAAAAGRLTPDMVGQARRILADSPARCMALIPARETIDICLDLEPRSIAHALSQALHAESRASADTRLLEFEAALTERIAAAWPTIADPSPVPHPLRVFRSAMVTRAGVGVRARALAAEHPEQLSLAEALVATYGDPATIVARFDAARTASEAPAPPPDEPAMDGPKRKFTAGHLALAMIILGLTVWHYLWR